MDRCRTVDTLDFCKEEGEKGTTQDNISEGEYKHYMETNKKLHSIYIMITSQQTRYELQSEQYMRLVHGQFSAHMMGAPLKRIPFFQYYQDLSKLIHSYSIENKKAELIIEFLCIVLTKNRGHFFWRCTMFNFLFRSEWQEGSNCVSFMWLIQKGRVGSRYWLSPKKVTSVWMEILQMVQVQSSRWNYGDF